MPGQELRGGEGGDPSSKVYEEIRALQRALKEISQSWGEPELDPGTDGGTYDDATQTAVKRFQERIGLAADGVVGEATWHKLEEYWPNLAAELQQIQQQPAGGQNPLQPGGGGQPIGQGIPDWDGEPNVAGGWLKFRIKGDMVGAIPANSVTGSFRITDASNMPLGDEVTFYYPTSDVTPGGSGEAEVLLTVPIGAADGEYEITVFLVQNDTSNYKKTTFKVENDRITD
jgi:peptidoglycan hydrolase-like protein with peptidoglycan-binding domain